MGLQVTAIMIGVKDLASSKAFYAEGLGCAIDQDYPNFVSFKLGDGSSSLASTSGMRRLKTRASSPTVPDSVASRSITWSRRVTPSTKSSARRSPPEAVS